MFVLKILILTILVNPSNLLFGQEIEGEPTPRGIPFTRRETSPVTIFPFSYAEVDVVCGTGEVAISGGFKFSTYGLNVVESYPDGRNWHFKIYNDEDITSTQNTFYAICSMYLTPRI